jgi:hypothetical protein
MVVGAWRTALGKREETGVRVTVYSPPGMHGEQIRHRAQKALAEAGLSGRVDLKTEEFEFARAGVMCTPAISVNGRLVTNGWVPEETEFARVLKANLNSH